MTRRRLNRIRLDKIAGVDLPCQQHATVAIVKRAPGAAIAGLAKATFDEALNGQMVSERVNRAFWDAFDGLYQRNDAFRTALTDELSEGGDGAEASAAYVASVNELVNTAVAAARSAGAKASDEEMNKAVCEAATSWLAKSTPQPKEQPMKIINKAALISAVATFAIAKSTAAEAAAITDAAVEFDALDALSEQPELLAIAEAKKSAAATAELQREVAILKMAPEQRAHFDGLSAEGQTAFLAKSDAERAAEIDALSSADPVVHKCADGTEIRKSDGPALLALAKRNDALTAELGTLRKGQVEASLEKRAAAYPNVAKSVAMEMLKSADTLGTDTPAGRDIVKSLETMNTATGGIFKSLGTTEGDGPVDIAKARQTYDAEVSKVAAERKISKADAMSAVRVERPDLFNAAFPQSADEDA